MAKLEITISKKTLFKLLQLFSYNQTFNDVANRNIDNISDISITGNDDEWFLKHIDRADAFVQRKIAHILDHDAMLKELKYRLSKETSAEDINSENLKYMVCISHDLQIHLLSDAIEDALIAEMFRYWCSQKGLINNNNYNQTIDNLRSISLMVNSKCRIPYVMN
ncbi:MAG: hypothetical protein R3Y51_06060 [Rikenellaceae bacterium]